MDLAELNIRKAEEQEWNGLLERFFAANFIHDTHPNLDSAEAKLLIAESGGKVKAAAFVRRIPGNLVTLTLSHPKNDVCCSAFIQALTERFFNDPREKTTIQLVFHDECHFPWLKKVGFEHVATFDYRVAPVGALESNPGGSLRYENVETQLDSNSYHFISRTFESTLDCPRLNEFRSFEETITTYQFLSRKDQQLWFRIFHHEELVGCLLLSTTDIAEILYFGVIPEQRGKGYGSQILRLAMKIANQQKSQFLSAYVDCGNGPAIRQYDRHGFYVANRNHVYMKLVRAEK